MVRYREILRLTAMGISQRNVAFSVGCAASTVQDVLRWVEYDTKKMVRTLETWVTKSVKTGRISLEEGKEFLNNYRNGLYGYTYLERD